ncbi:MAG: hypothetical protein ABI540_01540 [Spartobacteria bacterium]
MPARESRKSPNITRATASELFVRKFREHYPEWNFRYGLREILEEIHAAVV